MAYAFAQRQSAATQELLVARRDFSGAVADSALRPALAPAFSLVFLAPPDQSGAQLVQTLAPGEHRRLANAQPFSVSGEFQIAAPHGFAVLEGAHRAFPIDGAGRKACVVFLIVEQRQQRKFVSAGTNRPLNRIGDAGARRSPAPTGAKVSVCGRKNLQDPIAAAKRAAGPTPRAV